MTAQGMSGEATPLSLHSCVCDQSDAYDRGRREALLDIAARLCPEGSELARICGSPIISKGKDTGKRRALCLPHAMLADEAKEEKQ